MTGKQRRQGQKKADGKTAVPKPVCPKCGEICVRSYTRGNEERKRAYIGSGWMCPSKTCDYIIKDFVELTEEETHEEFMAEMNKLQAEQKEHLERFEGMKRKEGE